MLKNLFKPRSTEPIPDFKDVKVTLKPIIGIRPGLYLTFIYGFIILALIFCIFFLPGIINNGTWISFESSPLPAGIWIDGKKVGVTPCELLVPRGQHEIILSRPAYKSFSVQKDVGSYLFALPFLPSKDKIFTRLEVEDIGQLAATTFDEFSHWALIDAFSREYVYPPILTGAVRAIVASPDEKTYTVLENLLEKCLPHISLPETAADFLAACYLLESRGQGFSLSSLARLNAKMEAFQKTYPAWPFWLDMILPSVVSLDQQGESVSLDSPLPATREALEETTWFQALLADHKKLIIEFKPHKEALRQAPVSIAGSTFIPIPGGTYVMGKADALDQMLNVTHLKLFPHVETVKEFFIAQTEVTNRAYAQFIAENQEWAPQSRSHLVAEGLADENYLRDWNNNTYPEGKANHPVTFVSAYAADAYCLWLQTRLAGILPGYTVRLPNEAQWEWAACGGDPERWETAFSVFSDDQRIGTQSVGLSGQNLFGLSDMAGNVFEWCSDWFAKAAPLFVATTGNSRAATVADFPSGGDRSVRGGSWGSQAEQIDVYTRGGQPPRWCNAFTGFRPVLVEK